MLAVFSVYALQTVCTGKKLYSVQSDSVFRSLLHITFSEKTL